MIASLNGLYYRSRPFPVALLHDGSYILDVTTVRDSSEYRRGIQPNPTIRYLLISRGGKILDTVLTR